jgi:hypothetical protein
VDEGITELECGCEVETRSFGAQVRLCREHKHLAVDPRLRDKPDFSAKTANDPRKDQMPQRGPQHSDSSLPPERRSGDRLDPL